MPGLMRVLRNRRPALVTIGAILLLIIAANFAAGWFIDDLKIDIRPSNEDAVHKTIVTSAILYTALLAVPFVPGAEIGLSLIGVFGPPIVFLVYLCTVTGLTVSFLVGRLVPDTVLVSLCARLKLQRVHTMLLRVAPLSVDERLAFLTAGAPGRFVPFLLRHRHLAIAILINLPGNVIVGGGGGIALFAGISRLYSLPGFLVTVLLAAAPLPVAILLFGETILPGLVT